MKQQATRFLLASLAIVVVFFGMANAANAASKKKTVKPQERMVTTWLGRLYAGDGLDANSAYLDNPQGFTADGSCTFTIADTLNNVIRHINGTTNVISTIAGNGHYLLSDGPVAKASFRAPYDVALGPNGEMYVVDTENSRIRIISGGKVSTWLKNLKRPTGILLDGTTLYVSDTGNNRIVKATIPNGSPSVVANVAGPGKGALLGSAVYLTTNKNTSLSKIDLSTGSISTIKDGLTDLEGVAVYNGKVYFVASDRGMYNEVWRYDPATGEVLRLVNVVETEWYNHASDIVFCNDKMYLLFSSGSSIFRLELDATNPVKIAGIHRYGDTDGSTSEAVLGRPKSLILSKDKSKVYIVENHRFKVFDLSTQQLSFIAGSPMDNWRDDVGKSARMSGPTQAALSPDGKRIWFSDRNNNRIRYLVIDEARLVTLTGAGAVNQFAGESNGYAEGDACATQDKGVAGCAYFNRPTGIAVSKDGKTLYVTDSDNFRIRKVDAETGTTSFLAGGERGFKNGIGSAAKFKGPTNILLSSDGKKLYVVDVGNHAIRQIDLATKKVTTLVRSVRPGYREGKFKKARLAYPDSLAPGPGTTIYLSEVGSQRIRLIDLKTGEVRHVAGFGERGSMDGTVKKATFHNPKGMVQLNAKTLLVADLVNDLIRAVDVTDIVKNLTKTSKANKLNRR